LFNYKLTEHSVFTSTVWKDDQVITGLKFNFTAARQGVHRVIHLLLTNASPSPPSE